MTARFIILALDPARVSPAWSSIGEPAVVADTETRLGYPTLRSFAPEMVSILERDPARTRLLQGRPLTEVELDEWAARASSGLDSELRDLLGEEPDPAPRFWLGTVTHKGVRFVLLVDNETGDVAPFLSASSATYALRHAEAGRRDLFLFTSRAEYDSEIGKEITPL
jgi:hypothetical protein